MLNLVREVPETQKYAVKEEMVAVLSCAAWKVEHWQISWKIARRNVLSYVDTNSRFDAYTRSNYLYITQAQGGNPASSRRGVCIGSNAEDVEVQVPVGISVSIHDPGQESRLVGDLNRHDQRLVIAQGGNGGIPVTNYLGTPGESHSIVLDLKVSASRHISFSLAYGRCWSYWITQCWKIQSSSRPFWGKGQNCGVSLYNPTTASSDHQFSWPPKNYHDRFAWYVFA